MDESLLDRAKTAALTLLRDHPVLPKYKDSLTILLVGSIPAGFADDLSDVDVWVLCSSDVADSLAEEFRQHDLRFMTPPPHEIVVNGIEAHYFVFPIRKLAEALELHDDESLFLIAHCLAVHDPSGQFAALSAKFSTVPSDVVRAKIERAYTLVRQRAFSMRKVLRRYEPLAWVEHIILVAHSALQLCCWLDGKAPTGRHWLMQQAQACSTASSIVPAAMQLLRAIGPTLEHAPTAARDTPPVLSACERLDAAAIQAVARAGFGDIPRWEPPA